MSKSSVRSFLKRYDRYAKGVNLSYKRSTNYETSIGGMCSIISFTLLTYWVAVNTWDTFKPPGKFDSSSSIKLQDVDSDNDFPTLSIPLKQLIVSYNFKSLEIPDIEVNNYMVGLWFQ